MPTGKADIEDRATVLLHPADSRADDRFAVASIRKAEDGEDVKYVYLSEPTRGIRATQWSWFLAQPAGKGGNSSPGAAAEPSWPTIIAATRLANSAASDCAQPEILAAT